MDNEEIQKYSKNTKIGKFNNTLFSQKMQDFLIDALGAKKDTFIKNLTSLVINDVSLQNCEPNSIIFAATKATSLNLPLDKNLGFAYVIPYKDVAQFQIGFKGFVQLAIRSGQYLAIEVSEVREGDIKKIDKIRGIFEFNEYDATRANNEIIGYFAYFKLLNGFEKMVFWNIDEISQHAEKYSQSFKFQKKSSIWTTNFDAMAKKTVLKNLLSKWGILSIELQEAITTDQAVITTPSGDLRYIDNENTTTFEEINEDAANALLDSFFIQNEEILEN